jgi:hypothetical protein
MYIEWYEQHAYFLTLLYLLARLSQLFKQKENIITTTYNSLLHDSLI